MLLLQQHKAPGEDTAHLSLLACSLQPKTETFMFGSEGNWSLGLQGRAVMVCNLAQKRGALLFSSLLHSALLVSTDHISMEVVWRWEKHTSPKHKRIHTSLFFLLVLLCIQFLPSLSAPFLLLPACMESYCQSSVPDVWLHFLVNLIKEIWKM